MWKRMAAAVTRWHWRVAFRLSVVTCPSLRMDTCPHVDKCADNGRCVEREKDLLPFRGGG